MMEHISGRERGSAQAVSLLAAVVSLGAIIACGKKGPPSPPEPRGPLPPPAVTARQLGERVVIAFQVPQSRGPKPAQQPVRVEVVRVDYAPGLQAPADPDAFRRRGVGVAVLEADPLVEGARLQLVDPTLGLGKPNAVGGTLRYGIRVLDRRGRSSPLVVAKDLVPVEPPPAPSGLRGEATADGVRLTWDLPAGEGNSRYNLYRALPGEEFGERPLNATPLNSSEFLDSEAETGRAYLYQVRTAAAEDLPYRESEPSPNAMVVAEDRFAPARPEGLVAVQEGPAVRLFWNPNQERDLSGYRVYRGVDDGPWTRIGPDPVTQPLYLDDAVSTGDHLRYRVTAVDRADPPNESQPSEVAELDLAAEPPSSDGGEP